MVVDRDWLDEVLKEPEKRKLAFAALDAFDQLENVATISPDKLVPIIEAASCRFAPVWEIGADLLNHLAVRHQEARDAIRNMLHDRTADVRFQAITLLGSSKIPVSFAASLIRLGLRDRSYVVRGRVAEAACQLGLTELIPDL